MNDRRNPAIIKGVGETTKSHVGRLDEYLSKLEWQSEGHRMWYTHKNPAGCWICELLQVCRQYRENIDVDYTGNLSRIDPRDSEPQ